MPFSEVGHNICKRFVPEMRCNRRRAFAQCYSLKCCKVMFFFFLGTVKRILRFSIFVKILENCVNAQNNFFLSKLFLYLVVRCKVMFFCLGTVKRTRFSISVKILQNCVKVLNFFFSLNFFFNLWSMTTSHYIL